MTYTVFVDDNYHYMDKDARYTHGKFETLEAAIAAAQEIVDDVLSTEYEPGMIAADLCSRYRMFGEDPWISGPGDFKFSAWEYAEQRCAIICADDKTGREGISRDSRDEKSKDVPFEK